VGPFDEATTLIAEMTGWWCPSAVPRRPWSTAVDFEAFYAARIKGEAKPVPREILVGAIDCKGIPMVKPEGAHKTVQPKKGDKPNRKKMATVAAVFSQVPRMRTPEEVIDSLFATGKRPSRGARPTPTHKRVWDSLLSGKDAFIADVRAEMVRRDPLHRRTWVMVTAGERTLQRRVCTTFKGVTLVLDLLHVLEKLWAVSYVFHPEASAEAEAFVRERALRILHGQVGQVVKGLRQMSTKRRLASIPGSTPRAELGRSATFGL
jgi:hypothetical protein